jgi:Aromatic-ring-opening dioxygenase LigAB, LigA subunit
MNIYLIHKLCRRVLHDREFRQLILANPEMAVSSMPFTEAERAALLAGDVARLYREGASAFLLLILSRFKVFGLELPVFNRRMRTGTGE